MPALKRRKPLYPKVKQNLKARGLWKGPLRERLGFLRGPSTPKMYPKIKGSAASRYQRVGKPSLNVLRGPQKIVLEEVPTGRWGYKNPRQGDYSAVELTRTMKKLVPGDVISLSVTHRIKRLSRRGGAGKGGGGGERGTHVTGSAVARRTARVRLGGMRGARPQKEKKKTAKK